MPPLSDGLDSRRRRALYRAWHRGTREMDLLLGRFADAHIERLSDRDLADFEALLDFPDDDLFGWIVRREFVPEKCETPILAAIIARYAPDHESR
jgi:antitoxin CptB